MWLKDVFHFILMQRRYGQLKERPHFREPYAELFDKVQVIFYSVAVTLILLL